MTIKVKDGQSLYDLALQCYGDISGYWWLLEDNGLTVESEITPGQILNVRAEFIKDRAIFFRDTNKEINNSDQLSTDDIPLSAQVVEIRNEENGYDGFVRVSVTGGVTPYGFAWSNGTYKKNLLNVSAGTYTLVVEDAVGTQITLTVSVATASIDEYLVTKTGAFILTKSGNRIHLK